MPSAVPPVPAWEGERVWVSRLPGGKGHPADPAGLWGATSGAVQPHGIPKRAACGLREVCLLSCGLQRPVETQDFHEDGICCGPWKRGWMWGREA